MAFTISHRPHPPEGWLELLGHGLTFDCRGLHPGEPAPLPPAQQYFGIDPQSLQDDPMAVSLTPGAHLSAGASLLPVVRTTVGLAVRMLSLSGLVAVSWHAAGSWMEPAYFGRIAREWLGGGAFPAFGLTALGG